MRGGANSRRVDWKAASVWTMDRGADGRRSERLTSLPSTRGDHDFTLQVKDQDGITPDESDARSPLHSTRSFFLRPIVLVLTALALIAGGLLLSYVFRRYRHHRLELRLSEQTSLALLNASTDPSYLLDADGTHPRDEPGRRYAAGCSPGGHLRSSISCRPALAASRRSAMETVLQ